MIDGCTQILQIAPGAALVAAFLRILATLVTIDFGKHFCAPPVVEPADPLLEFADAWNGIFVGLRDFETVTKLGKFCIEIDRKQVSNRNRFDILGLALGSIFGGDIAFAQRSEGVKAPFASLSFRM